MKTFTASDGTSFIHHNGGVGPVAIVLPDPPRPPRPDCRTVQETSSVGHGDVDGEALIEFVAHLVEVDRAAKLEEQSPRELLGLDPLEEAHK